MSSSPVMKVPTVPKAKALSVSHHLCSFWVSIHGLVDRPDFATTILVLKHHLDTAL